MKINLTPIIDIVFLLILFLIVVHQRIDAENFPLNVPDNCSFARQIQSDISSRPTVSAFNDHNDQTVVFAVGPETVKMTLSKPGSITNWLKNKMNENLHQKNSKTLCLRIDKAVIYKDAQHVIAAAAASNAETIQLSAVKAKHPQ